MEHRWTSREFGKSFRGITIQKLLFNIPTHSTLKRRAGYISFDPPSVQLLRLVYKIEFAPLYQSMKTKDQKLAEIKGLARRAAQSFFSVLIFIQFGGKNLLKKLCQ